MRYGYLCLIGFIAGCSEPVAPTTQPETTTNAPEVPLVEKIATGSAISGANGLHFGPDGLLYIASVFGSELVAIDPDSGEVKRRLGHAEGVHGPDDVAFAPDGSFYWTSIFTGEVVGMTSSGELKVAAKLAPGVNPITFSDTGRLFVAQCFFGDKLYEVDPAGVKEARMIADDLGPDCALNGMDWGPDGRLYGPRWFANEVVSLDVETGKRRVEASGFKTPAAVKFDSAGRLHVMDTADGTITRVDKDSKTVVATIEPGLDNFAFDTKDRLFVSSFVDGFVVRIEADGTATKLLPGGMAHPAGVTTLTRNGKTEIIVADFHSIRGFDPQTGAETFAQKSVFGIGVMGSVLAIAADGPYLILSSFTDNSVRVWDPDSARVVRRWDGLALPMGVVPYAGGVAVALHGSKSVVLLGDGEPLTLAAELGAPTDVTVQGDALMVSDRDSGRILKIAVGGKAITPEIVVEGLVAPEGLTSTDEGIVVVEGESGRVLLVRDGKAELVGEVSKGSLPVSPMQPPAVIINDAVAHDGRLYVTGESEHALYRINRFGNSAP